MTLYVVATPIGNRGDISLRALDVLKNVDVVAAEDTRKTGRLLDGYDIKKRLISHHEHNERRGTDGIIKLLHEGNDVALVTNAGTPLVSDPGYVLVRRAIDEGFDVVPVPGPCAAIAALSVSGLPTHEVHFLGFAPKKKAALEKSLACSDALKGTLIYYESPNRVVGFLETAQRMLGDRRAVIAREMTKLHEEIARGTLGELAEHFAKPPKGELVVLIEGV
jgi:16S rRNA (cytidine1402-2'-O)-methyltransferase